MPKGNKRGRPAYRATIKDRTTVEQMKFCGEPNTVIARALGIDVKTLEKHFGEELENGHANRRRELTTWMFEAAAKGNASMQKHLDQIGRAAGAQDAVRDREPKPAKLGKKEERQAAAQEVGGIYSPPAAPKLVVNNS